MNLMLYVSLGCILTEACIYCKSPSLLFEKPSLKRSLLVNSLLIINKSCISLAYYKSA